MIADVVGGDASNGNYSFLTPPLPVTIVIIVTRFVILIG